MTTLHIGATPLVKTADQRRAERRARRERPYAVVSAARSVFWTLSVAALVGADRIVIGIERIMP